MLLKGWKRSSLCFELDFRLKTQDIRFKKRDARSEKLELRIKSQEKKLYKKIGNSRRGKWEIAKKICPIKNELNY
ncbi:hypothetical protein SAMN00777080_4360 [Aquiflexum balticum DSM 16537]|uniref:Uncharacterized protein n=1 Tax=Aquiflexum balticum DSM 16537 TaxID=758820 RepID=A0A1W2H9Y3_9BACT|nr:hypothetical protein SAMN00777080_4360 [Aquiflexum balticum DSM 16537]